MTSTAKEILIMLLWDNLAKVKSHKDRRMTAWGSKTQEGLIASIECIVEEKGE